MQLQPNIKRFEDVRNRLTAAIVDGKFKPGDRLPSVRDLAAYFHVALRTVQRALQDLKNDDWVVSVPGSGISVSDPLPPIERLMRTRNRNSADAGPLRRTTHGSPAMRTNGVLKCRIYDERMLPLFEWAAREYAAAYAPLSLEFEIQTFPSEESLRNLDADLVMLQSHEINRAVSFGTITSARGMLTDPDPLFAGVAPGLMDLVSHAGELWAVPLMAGGAILTAHAANCAQCGMDPASLTSVDAMLSAMEAAVARPMERTELRLFNLTFSLVILTMAGYSFSSISQAPAMLAQLDVRALLERLRTLAQHPAVVLARFDQWERIDLAALAIRHQPSELFCQDPANREGSRVLPVPVSKSGGVPLVAHCMCISARSIHPYEAWEWAAHLAAHPFQQRLAALGYQIPASLSPDVERAFAGTVGDENARTLLDLTQRPCRLYGIGPEDTLHYLWEVLSNEIYRFVAGTNDYERLLERVATKTERYLNRAGGPTGVDASTQQGMARAEVQHATGWNGASDSVKRWNLSAEETGAVEGYR